ncbi:hypothetical protein GCM10022252_79730 [Streptosporangium oxazolinicum]|uniref:Uncharacterized protein n=1 Tax=Streptosporangium oxazolinicum TaxID=909287 RepID=A0ABP8BNB8_9ACTN
MKVLRAWMGDIGGRDVDVIAELGGLVPDPATKSVFRFLAMAGRSLFSRSGKNWIPGLGGRPRWFMRKQGFMVPKHSMSFLGFAERLTLTQRGSENEKEVKALLVHAFLEDLRVAYRRRGLILPRRQGWRRTAYVTVLLDNVTVANGGWELLELINTVRNKTGELDPLLVIAVSEEQSAPMGEAEPAEPGRALTALENWRRNLPSRRQRLASDARYLLLRLPEPTPADRLNDLNADDAGAWGRDHEFASRASPFLARPWVAESLVSLAVVPALVVGAVNVRDHLQAGCSPASLLSGWFSDDVLVEAYRIGEGNSQCVGYSADALQVFTSGGDEKAGEAGTRLRTLQLKIFEQNDRAGRLHELKPGRPLVGLVYFAGLTHQEADPDTDDAVAEELEGLLLRQREQNTPNRQGPLLRIVIANGAEKMVAADEVARRGLTPLLRSDPTIMGVVGFDRTVRQTRDAIGSLGAQGVIALGTTLTGERLAQSSPLYFQLVPSNAQQAILIVGYAKYLRNTKVTLYYPRFDKDDVYIETLLKELRTHLKTAGLEVREATGAMASLCGDPEDSANLKDRSDEMLFYAGREDGFGDFLTNAVRGCHTPARLPTIVADDATSRFMAQNRSRSQAGLPAVPVSYVGMGNLVVLAGKDCLEGRAGGRFPAGTPIDTFCTGMSALRGEMKGERKAPWVGERVGVAYDAAGMVIEATRSLSLNAPVHRAGVGQWFRENTFGGVTGLVDFTGSRIGDRRNIAVLRIPNIRDLDAQPVCVFLQGDLYEVGDLNEVNRRRSENGCPLAGS